MKSKKIIVDIVTIALLVCAFGLAYYTGLVGTREDGTPMLAANTFALIAICSSLVMMLVGGVSELVLRVKNNAVTVSFTVFMAVQVVSLICMCALSVALLSGAFSRESNLIRVLFIMSAAVQILGYIQSVIYTGGFVEEDAVEAADEDETVETENDNQSGEYEVYYTDDDQTGEENGEEASDN